MNLLLDNGKVNEIKYFYDIAKRKVDLEISFASNNIEKVIENLLQCKNLYFASSFTYPEEVAKVGSKLLMLKQPINIYVYNYGSNNILSEFKNVFSTHEIEKLLEIGHKFYNILINDDFDDFIISDEINIRGIVPNYVLESEKVFVPLDFKIVTKEIKATGEMFQIKPETVLDAYYLKGDTKKLWGVYVKSPVNGQFVKLIISDNYNEFELYEEDKKFVRAVLHYIYSLSPLSDNDKQKHISFNEMAKYVNTYKCIGINEEENLIPLILSILDLEKRGNKNIIKTLLNNYRENHRYFLEYDKGVTPKIF